MNINIYEINLHQKNIMTTIKKIENSHIIAHAMMLWHKGYELTSLTKNENIEVRTFEKKGSIIKLLCKNLK